MTLHMYMYPNEFWVLLIVFEQTYPGNEFSDPQCLEIRGIFIIVTIIMFDLLF